MAYDSIATIGSWLGFVTEQFSLCLSSFIMHNIPCLWIVIGDLWGCEWYEVWHLCTVELSLWLVYFFSKSFLHSLLFFCFFLACVPSNVTHPEQLSMVQPKPDPELLLRHRYSCFWESWNGLLDTAGFQRHRSLNSVPNSVPLSPTTPLKSRSSSPTHFTMATVKAKSAG